MKTEQETGSEAVIRFLSGPLTNQSIPLQNPVIAIGRDRQNDIVILDQGVSRHHARISQFNGSWMIENLSQSSFVAINQQRIEQQSILPHNSVVQLGENTSFVFLAQQPTVEQKPSDFETVSYIPPLPSAEMARIPTMSAPDINDTPVFKMPNIPLNVSPAGTVLAPMPAIGPTLTVSSNIHSDV